MKHTKSILHSPRLHCGIKILSIFPNEIYNDKKRHKYYSPSSHTQLLSIPSHENIQKNPSFPTQREKGDVTEPQFRKRLEANTNANNTQTDKGSNQSQSKGKEKKEINIRLNIQSDFIQSNYLCNQFKYNKKYSTCSLLSSEDVILQQKERQIEKLKKELTNAKHQISYLLNEKNIKQTIEKIDLSPSEYNLSDRMNKMSIINKKKTKGHQSPIKSSAFTSTNVRQFFSNNSLSLRNQKTQSTKQMNLIQGLISPKHCYSSDIREENTADNQSNNNNNRSSNSNSLKKTFDALRMRTLKVFNMYLSAYNNLRLKD